MIPYEQKVRMADAATPDQPASASGPAPVEGVPVIPDDALILITTRNLVLFPGSVLPTTLGPQRPTPAAHPPAALVRRGADGHPAQPAGRAGIAARSGDRRSDAGRPASRRHRSEPAALCDQPRWQPSRDLPGRAALPHRRVSRRLSILCRPNRAGARDRGYNHRNRRPPAQSAQPGARSPAIAAADPGGAGQ